MSAALDGLPRRDMRLALRCTAYRQFSRNAKHNHTLYFVAWSML